MKTILIATVLIATVLAAAALVFAPVPAHTQSFCPDENCCRIRWGANGVDYSRCLGFLAQRQARGGSTGHCPAGTCAKNGTNSAKDVKNCSASNCR